MNILILLDGMNRTSDVSSVSIQVADTDYVNTVDVSLQGEELYALLAPNLSGEERIEIRIYDVSYFFMLEERDQAVEFAAKTFTIWGRSRAARLDEPYVRPFSTPEFASPAFASALIERYSGGAVTFQTLEGVSLYDFMVPADTLSVAGQTAISIIQELATAMGGIVRSFPDGGLCIRPARPHPERMGLFQGQLDRSGIKSIKRSNVMADRGNSTMPPVLDALAGVYATGVDTWSGNAIVIELGGDALNEERSFTLEVDLSVHPDGTPESGPVTLAFSQSAHPPVPYHLVATAGSCSRQGQASTVRTELLTITNIENIRLQFPATSIVSVTPIGSFPGTLSLVTSGQSLCRITPNAGFETSFFGLCDVTYNSIFDRWLFSRSGDQKILVVALSDEQDATGRERVVVQRGSGDERIVETIANPLITTRNHAEAIGMLRATQSLWSKEEMTIEHFWLQGLHDGNVLSIDEVLWVITGYTIQIDATGIMTTTKMEGNYA